jgi:glycosyltransferase involved in cell wall biosynthesis
MIPEVTIIIPCFNCTKTLEESFASALNQKIDVPFEIVMVDDGSTDGTKSLMQKLAEGKENVRLFFHEKNKGGGAARNTAIQNARAGVIFCLDSDDLLPEDSLSKMYHFLKEKGADAVGIERSLKFKGRDKSDIFRTDVFGFKGERIPVSALIEKSGGPYNPLYSTFMHTKEAFYKAGGYTEFHGFDTQSLAWRFLAHGLKAYTCPGAEYLHRQHFGETYYVREYESGKLNYNWFDIFDEFIFLFKPAIQREILSFDFSSPNLDIMDNVKVHPDPLNTELFPSLAEWYSDEHIQELASGNNAILKYWAGSELLRKGLYSKALSVLEEIKTADFPYKTLQEKINTCKLCIEGKTQREAYQIIASNRIYIKRGSQAPFIPRLIRKIKKEIKNRPSLSRPIYGAYSFLINTKNLFKRHAERREYYRNIELVKKNKEIVFDVRFGGLGDWLTFTTLPRLLSEQYGVSFYISKKSVDRIRNKDIYKLCFEMNPYCKGLKDVEKPFEFEIFSADKSIFNFITDEKGLSVTEQVEKQFGLKGEGVPEIFYQPKEIPGFEDTVLVDKNYISGKKVGWIYNDKSFDDEIARAVADSKGTTIEYADPTKQDLFTYVDKIHSCKHFITVLSGGAALATCFNKPFTVILPENVYGGSVDNFIFKKSSGTYRR